MNAQQLLEMALLDSCGLLEDDELEQFETAFAEAPESIKAQIRREQSRFADQSELLPDVSPRPELRRLVVDAVRRAAGAAVTADTLRFERMVSAGTGPTPADIHRRRVMPAWRAAAIVLAVTTVFGGVLSLELRNQIGDMGNRISSITSADLFLRYGNMPGLQNAMFGPNSERVLFSPVDPSMETIAAVFTNTETERSYFVCNRLPVLENGQYEIVVLDDDQKYVSTITTFTSNGETDGHEFAFTNELRGNIAIAARTASGALELVMIVAA
ncbi:MAG: hypothetical protein ACIAQ0_04565 [Phycisphaerales bacterium JB058]|jgi:hypothetical protein